MKRVPVLTWVAISLLVAGFLYSVVRHLGSRARAVVEPGTEVIRFAHWQLEPGVREALDEIAREYMALHPQVRVEQMPIPGRAWTQWLRTQLVGGTAPDLIELASYYNPDDMLARYFTPITDVLAEVNPYNADEPDLRDVPWRQTYAAELVPAPDGLGHYYSANLLEYYGVPTAMVTVRVFYNRDLIRAATGEDRTPETFEEFVALCEALQQHSHSGEVRYTPLGGSIFNITRITDALFGSVTQKLALELDIGRDLELSKHESLITYARGRWSLQTPAVRASLQTVEEFGRYLPPGWVQLGREDSMLQFLQGRAALLATGTWDAGGILMQADFPVGAFKVPAFSRDDPRFGAGTLGPASEAAIFATMAFGLTRGSKHPERAIDFLRFLTSRRSNAKFAEISKWLPVIKGVSVPEEAKPFEPLADGYIPGVNIRGLSLRASDILMQNLYLLSGSGASADNYIARTSGQYDRLVVEELARLARITLDTVRQRDSVLAGLYHAAPPVARSKFDRLAASQLDSEIQRLQSLRTLEDYPGK